jgi:hypothetical protein
MFMKVSFMFNELKFASDFIKALKLNRNRLKILLTKSFLFPGANIMIFA